MTGESIVNLFDFLGGKQMLGLRLDVSTSSEATELANQSQDGYHAAK